MCGLTVGIFLGNHVSDKLGETRDIESELRSTDWYGPNGPVRTRSIHSQSSGVAGLLAIPSDIPKPIQTTDPIEHTEGTLHSKLQLNKVICTYIKFNGTFDGVPGNVKSQRHKISSLNYDSVILVESTSKNIRVTVNEQSSNQGLRDV